LLLAARLANLLLGVGLILLIGWWAWRIWGSSAALLAIALAAFEPNFVAHASLVTTDIGATLFSLLTLYLLWECFNLRNPRLLIGAGLALGAALVSKFSTVILLAIGGALILPAPFFDPALGFFAGAQNPPRPIVSSTRRPHFCWCRCAPHWSFQPLTFFMDSNPGCPACNALSL
jgi:hypothetical protein